MYRSTRPVLAVCAALAVAASSAGTALAAGGPARSPGTVRTGSSAWSVVRSPNEGPGSNTLNAVSCLSVSACTAVGSFKQTGNKRLIESWNGTTWSVVPPGNKGRDGFLYGVSCVSASACTAVGSSNGAVVESWNGANWSIVPSPKVPGGTLAAVSCVSGTACIAVGWSQSTAGVNTLAESWNGAT
jgi:hypothetical protein